MGKGWRKHCSIARPFSVPLYPLPPLVFCCTCAYMFYASVAYAKWLLLIGTVPVVIGGVLALILRTREAASRAASPE